MAEVELAPSVRPAVVVEWDDGRTGRVLDDVAREEPLEIRLAGDRAALMMRTPGHDVELAIGFLFTEGVIASVDDLARLETPAMVDGATLPNTVAVGLRPGVGRDVSRLVRHFSASSACGVCGRASIDDVRVRRSAGVAGRFCIASSPLCRLPGSLRDAQPVFARTGGLHAAALFDENGAIVVVREDIGRHNAVDKVIGWAVASRRVPLEQFGLIVSGRGGFDVVQKCVVAGVPLVASLSAPSSLAVQLAREMGQTLVGFLRGRRFVIYSGEERIRQG